MQVAVSTHQGKAGSWEMCISALPLHLYEAGGITPRDHSGPVSLPASFSAKLICLFH